MEYNVIKQLHILFAIVSLTGFIFRGVLTLQQSSLLKKRWLRVVPHINDTLLLVSAIILAIQGGYNPLQHHWLTAKIVLLIVYIIMGLMTLRFSKSHQTRMLYFILAILTFVWIAGIALNKSVVLF